MGLFKNEDFKINNVKLRLSRIAFKPKWISQSSLPKYFQYNEAISHSMTDPR